MSAAGLGALLVALTAGCAGEFAAAETPPTSSSQPNATSIVQEPGAYAEVKAANPTRLTRRGPSPQSYTNEPLEGVSTLSYRSPAGELRAWAAYPMRGDPPFPAVVYLHGGFATGPAEMLDCGPLFDAGFAVIIPAFRGENGNPGDQEYWFGEVEDAAAAVRHVAKMPSIDAKRIYAFGHSSGGVIAGHLSLLDDLPLVVTGSAGGIYPEQTFDALPAGYPFDIRLPMERRLRGWVHWLASVKRPHHAWVGKGEWLNTWVAPLKVEVARTHAPVTVSVLEGDHFTALEPAMTAFAAQISAPGAPGR